MPSPIALKVPTNLGDSLAESTSVQIPSGVMPAQEEFGAEESTSPTLFSHNELKDFLAIHSPLAVLRHCFGIQLIPNTPALLDHAVLNTIDCEWNERPPYQLTEIGLAAVLSSFMHAVTDKGRHGETLLKQVYFDHFRLIPNAHLINTRFCPGDPTKNRFGKTWFVTEYEAQDMMKKSFNCLIDTHQPQLGYCPVILIGHAVDNDTRKIAEALELNNGAFERIVFTIDTQRVARELGIRGKGNEIGLKVLCQKMGFEFKDPHTATNDAAYTLFNAVFMALHCGLPELIPPPASNKDSTKSTQQVVNSIEAWTQTQSDPTFGIALYCERCGTMNTHLKKECRTKVNCKKCVLAKRTQAARSHRTENCSFRI